MADKRKRRTVFSFLRKILKFLLSRMVIVGLLLVAELCFLFLVMLRFGTSKTSCIYAFAFLRATRYF